MEVVSVCALKLVRFYLHFAFLLTCSSLLIFHIIDEAGISQALRINVTCQKATPYSTRHQLLFY